MVEDSDIVNNKKFCPRCKNRNFIIQCACGQCNETLTQYNRYGHERKFIQSHIWRGKKHTDATKQKLSKFFVGREGYWTGKEIPKEAIEKQIKTKKERYVKEKHPMYGKKHNEESKKQMSESAKARGRRQYVIRDRDYIYLYLPSHPNANKDGHVGQHVYVMSEHIGRPLKKGEHVHHRNHNRSDNRLENLELHTASTHMQTHRLEYKESIVGRKCDMCGSLTTSTNRKKDKKTGKYYEASDWRRNPLDRNMWLCRICYNRVKYYKIKKW